LGGLLNFRSQVSVGRKRTFGPQAKAHVLKGFNGTLYMTKNVIMRDVDEAIPGGHSDLVNFSPRFCR
jgi:hypothetical protein